MEQTATGHDGLAFGIELETVHQTKLEAPSCRRGDMANDRVTEGPLCALERRSDKIRGNTREANDISPKLTNEKQLQLHQHKSSRSTKEEDSDDRDEEDDKRLSSRGQKLEVVVEQQQHQSYKHLSARPRIWSSSSTVSSHDRSQIFSRAPSMADSVVDSWTPTLAGRGGTGCTKSPAFRTVSLSNEHLNDADVAPEEESTLRLARPASRRGGLPIFDPVGMGNNSARGGLIRSMSNVSTEPPRDASSPWEQTPRASWSLSEDGGSEHCSRDDPGSPTLAGFGATFGRPLSPIQSVLSTCSGSKAPYCLDDLRAREGGGNGEMEEDDSEGAGIQGKSPPKSAPRAAVVSRSLGRDATSSSTFNGSSRSGRSRSRRPIPRIAPAPLHDGSRGSEGGKDDKIGVGGTKRGIPSSSSPLSSSEEEKGEAPAAPSSTTGTSIDVRDSMRSTSTALTDVQTFEKPAGSSSPVPAQESSHTSSSFASFTTGEAVSSSSGPADRSDSDDPFSYSLSESEKRKLYGVSPPYAPDFASASNTLDVSSKNDGITDNRISPFYADNASVWKAAAAAAANANSVTASSSHARAGAHWRKPSRSLLEELRAARTNKNCSSDEDDVGDGGATSAAFAPSPSHAGGKKGLSGAIWRSVKQMGIFQRQARVESARIVPRPPAPESLPPQPSASASAAALISTPVKKPHPEVFSDVAEEELMFAKGSKNHKLAKGEFAPAFGGHGPLTKTPMISPFGTDIRGKSYGEDDTASSTSGTDSPSPVKAQARAEGADGDVEDGGLGMAGVRVEEQMREVSWAEVAEAARRVLATVSEEETIVLPCAPTEEEKVLYYDSGRLLVIPCAVVAFITLSTGTWLFTIVHPAFYWFGLPSAFLMVYLGCHYLGIAIWGKDFSPEKHAEIVQESERQGYEPSVDVFLPVCKEPAYLLANTWKHVWALDYPNYRVHVLDDGDKAEVKALAEAFGFNYMVRPDRPALKKAGNLRHAFSQTSGDAIAIFDADFCPRQDFLKETIPYLAQDASIGIVQTPQFFRYREEQTWIEKGAGITQEFFYRLVQVNQDRFHASVCVGSCGVYRRTALEPFGGMAAIGHSEDMYTGFKMTELGYRIKYVPLPLAMGTCPDEPQSFFMQQYRWAMGSATLVLEKEFWRSKISSFHKLCFLNGMLYYMATALMLFLTPIPFLMLVWINADEILWYHSAFTLPAIVFAAGVMPLWCTQRYGMACHRVRVIQCYAHLYAIKDRLMGRSAPWVPSGSGASRGASATFKSSVRLLVVWNAITTALVVGGCIWRMTDFTWYHFVPAIVITVGGFILSISTLFT